MVKKLDFKDFVPADYKPGATDQEKYNAKKRKKDTPQTSEGVEHVDEALTMQQRLKRSRQMKKYKTRMKIGRERAERKTADVGRLKKRARKQARLMLAKKLAKADYNSLSFSRKQEIEKRLDKMGSRIDRVARKLLPKMRKLEMERKRGNKGARLDRTTSKND